MITLLRCRHVGRGHQVVPRGSQDAAAHVSTHALASLQNCDILQPHKTAAFCSRHQTVTICACTKRCATLQLPCAKSTELPNPSPFSTISFHPIPKSQNVGPQPAAAVKNCDVFNCNAAAACCRPHPVVVVVMKMMLLLLMMMMKLLLAAAFEVT